MELNKGTQALNGQSVGSFPTPADKLLALQRLNQRLAQDPPKAAIRTRQFKNPGGGFKEYYYLPVSYIQKTLSEIFGWWETTNFKTQVVANEILGSIELRVYNPVFDSFSTVTGTAAVMITQRKGAKPSDIDAKYSNALETAAGHLKSDCITNAAKDLGRAFGRDLNRKFNFQFNPNDLSSVDRLKEIESDKLALHTSVQLLDKYTKEVNKYKDPVRLYKDAAGLSDKAEAEGILPSDMEVLRAHVNARYVMLKGRKAQASVPAISSSAKKTA